MKENRLWRRSGFFSFRGRGERRVSTILLIVFLLSVGLLGLRSSSAERALAEPRPRPLSQTLWTWSPNIKVNDDTGTAGQEDPAIALDPSGNAYAVWLDERSGNADIYFSYRPAGGSWGANVKVNDDLGTASHWSPAIAVDPSGNAYAVCSVYRNGDSDIYFSYRPSGGSWGANVKVNDDTGSASQGSIAVDPSGNAYAVWCDYRNGNPDIYFSYRPAGGDWGTNVKVNDDPGTPFKGGAAIAVDSSGNAYAVWHDHRNGNFDIYFSYRPAGGDWGTNVKVNDHPGTADQVFPAIAVDSSGNGYAVWADSHNDPDGWCDKWTCVLDIYFSHRPAGGSWGTNVRVNDNTGTVGDYAVAIAVNSPGNAYAVWCDYRNGNPDIYFSYRPAGGGWSPNVKVSDDPGTAFQQQPAIAADGTGNAYAVWYDPRNGNPDIYFSYGLWWEPTSSFFLPIVTKNY